MVSSVRQSRREKEKKMSNDPLAAAEVLVALNEKDRDETICRYPTCHAPRRATETGRPSAYCSDSGHTAVTNHRARASLKASASGVSGETPTKKEHPTGAIPVESLRSSVLQSMTQLQSGLERYISTLVEITDPDISVAQIQAVQDRAETRIAEAQQNVSTERSLRLAAEAASSAARQEAQAEREAAELAIQHMEEADAKAQRVSEDAEQQIVAMRQERDATVERVRNEAQQQIEEAFREAKEVVAFAEAEATTARGEARQAEERAHDAQVDAQARIVAAEQLVREANATVERERTEVDRLRKEHETTIQEARRRAEADRAEAAAALARERAEVSRVREEVVTVTKNAREQAAADRGELDRLRADLAASHIRADQLATLADELRTQLTQLLGKQKPRS